MISFVKTRKGVKHPERRYGDAGIDVFIPEYTAEYFEVLKSKNPNCRITATHVEIPPHEAVLIPLGLKTHFPPNIALEAANKSGVCTKTGLIVGAQVIDSSYQGEIHAHMINTSNYHVKLEYGQKLVQFVPRKIYEEEVDVHNDESTFIWHKLIPSERGEGGFGSTGK